MAASLSLPPRGRDERRHALAVGNRLAQDRQPFGLELVVQDHDSGDVAARPRVALGEPELDQVGPERNDRHCSRGRGGSNQRGGSDRDDGVRPGGQQLAHQPRQRIRLQANAAVEEKVSAFGEAELRKLRQGYLSVEGLGER
jgi:hypothetical protein